jgi:CelD/BcsL family acetyltransferase involved in cellulose biosynthesis
MDTVTTVEGVVALKADYEHLNQAAASTLPFALHDWHVAWCRHFFNCSRQIQDELLFLVMREAAGSCIGILPFILSRRRVGPLKVVSVDLLGADPAITEIRTPLVAPGYERLAAYAAQSRLNTLGNWDWIYWTGIGGAFGETLAAGGRLLWQPAVTDFVLDMPPTWGEFRLRLNRNIRESLRHCYNSLKRDHHSFELQVIDSLPELQRGLDRFLALHLMRANAESGPMHPDRFASRVSREFLFDVCERLCRRGALRLFQLKVGSKIVAMRMGFLTGDGLYLYYSGFDPAWSRYSVMTTALAEIIKYAIAHGIKTVNLSPGKVVSKTRWGPREVDYHSAYEQGARLRSRLARRVYVRAKSGEGLPSWLLQHVIAARRDWH